METILPIVGTAPIFAGIAESEIEAMLHCLSARRAVYRKGDYLLRCGDSVEEVGLVLCGSLLVVQEDFWGNRNLMAQVRPGQIFAEAFACSPGSVLNVSAEAAENTEVMWLNVRRILTTCPSACAHHSRMVRNLLSDIAGKNLRLNEKLTHMSRRTTREKLLSFLSAEAQRANSSEFDLSLNRQQLADYLSVERSAMSAELSRLRDAGVLSCTKNHFILHTVPEL